VTKMIQDIFNTQSVGELKKMGKYIAIRYLIQEELTGRLQIKARGWNDLYNVIFLMRKIGNLQKEDCRVSCAEKSEEIPYFKSETDRLIYSLTELSGEPQLKALCINKSHFRDAKKAKILRNSIAHKVHPDRTNHPKAEEAMSELTKLFHGVIG
jgi:hypothetical protein